MLTDYTRDVLLISVVICGRLIPQHLRLPIGSWFVSGKTSKSDCCVGESHGPSGQTEFLRLSSFVPQTLDGRDL